VAFIVSSPIRRTLQTSLLGFNFKPLPHPGFQENSAKPCDTGSAISLLLEEFPELDFGLVVDGWSSKEGEWSPDETSLAKRAAKMRTWLKEREEEDIIVVTHGGILFILVSDIRIPIIPC
jgi:broad specificity phosphatase PhoE